MLKFGVSKAVRMAYGCRCQYCGGVATEADHIVPVASGGSDDARNLTASCKRCNTTKHAKRLPKEIEKKLLMMAFIYAGEVENMASKFR
jgi:5-methylcytosine-specific restriction endonuclease McrA